ncbi:MAG: septal ring lytic transglycosylase RlpA family protein [Bergeyella zoohelcum]|nr:septal ring lytic transglycosylase RlpA family protein [Bergeyella zoohelcum]
MIKKGILTIIMMISAFGIFSFTASSREAKTGKASYYHDKFNGKRTASGEIFDNSKFTAAHRTLPFGTKIKVTNMKTDESVVVTINDRGPFHSSRVIDLSKAAFDEIGNLSAGTLLIEYELID